MLAKPNIDIEQILEGVWLGLGDTSKHSFSDILKPREEDFEKWGITPLRVMNDVDYIGYACKVFLNVDLLPQQCVIMQEMWDKTFPMYIATRGYGKATGLDEVIQTSTGWVKMRDIKVGDKAYGRDGKLHNIVAIHPQGKKRTYRLKLIDGRSVECCEDHLWVVKYQKRERTFSTKELFDRKLKLQSKESTSSCNYPYSIPNCEAIQYEKQDLLIDPYILGCLLGDGSMKGPTPRISSDDDFIIQQFCNILDDFTISRDKTNNNYTIVDNDKCYVECDNRWNKKHIAKVGNRLHQDIKQLKLNVNCKAKFIPEEYKRGSIEQRLEIVRGLMDTDGSINKYGSSEFTNTCEQLVDDLIEILRSLGITCTKSQDNREGEKHILPQGTEGTRGHYFRVFINTSEPIFKLPRKLDRISNNISTSREKYVSIVEVEKTDEYQDMQCITVDNPDHTYITTNHVVTHNSYIMAVYCLLKMILTPPAKAGGAGVKIIIVGAAFRQAKVIFEYMETVWRNSSRLRSLCSGERQGVRRDVDRCTITIGENTAIAIPLGNGDKIRGLRANIILCDEFSSVPPDIYETVVQGFAAVTANPIDNVKRESKMAYLKSLGIEHTDGLDDYKQGGNQSILSGTAGYDFQHFAEYWRKYKTIIESCGDPEKLKDVYPEGVPEGFNWKDFCIIRIPCELVPRGFMDDTMLARARATTHTGLFQMEYGAVFTKDSNGFFKRSLIERCVANHSNVEQANWPRWCSKPFDAQVRGDPNKKYVFGVDPASESDNFSVVIVELGQEHSKLVYCWTTTRRQHIKRSKSGETKENDFYAFCARKIRELMTVFPCERVGLDAQGGGIAVMEALHNKNNLQLGEIPIWPIIDEGKASETDNEPGLHILELVQFARYEWLSGANHGLRQDMENMVLLLPCFDPVSLEFAVADDYRRIRDFEEKHGKQKLVLFDTLEDCVLEIEELKKELTTIAITKTGTGVNSRDRWDTPEIKLETGKKGRLRKDRYSALLIANMVARQSRKQLTTLQFDSIGGIIEDIDETKHGDIYSNAPEWLKNSEDFYNSI